MAAVRRSVARFKRGAVRRLISRSDCSQRRQRQWLANCLSHMLDEPFRLRDANTLVMSGVGVVMSAQQLVTTIDTHRSAMTLSMKNTPLDDQAHITQPRVRSIFLAPVAVAAANFLNALGPPPRRRSDAVTSEANTRR